MLILPGPFLRISYNQPVSIAVGDVIEYSRGMWRGKNEILHVSGLFLDSGSDDILVAGASQQLDILVAHQPRISNDDEVASEVVSLHEVINDGYHRISLELSPVKKRVR